MGASTTKMFGKYFDTCSDTTHNSIWSESDADDENDHDESNNGGYILTQFTELDSDVDAMSKTSSFSPRGKPPKKLGKHGMNLSFASTVDLGSMSGLELSDDNSANIVSIAENSEIEYSEKQKR